MSEEQPPKTLDIDGHRPIDDSDLEVAETLEIDGSRPVEAVSDYLKPDSQPTPEADQLDAEEITEVDQEHSVVRGNREVKAIMDIDGKRPIVANDFEIEETLNIDGKRPIAADENFNESSD